MINSGPDGSARLGGAFGRSTRPTAMRGVCRPAGPGRQRLAHPDRPTSGGYTQLHDGRSGLTWPLQEANLHGTRLAHSLDVVHTDRETYEQTNGGREAGRESERHVQKHTLTVRDRGGGGDTQDVGRRLL